MTTPTPPQAPPPGAGYGYDDDEISLAELIQKGREWARIIWEERRFVAKVVGVSVGLGLVIAFGSRPEYTASTKILPYRSGGGGAAGLAALAGVRLPQGAADQTITADLYPEVAKTLDFHMAVAETPIRFSSLPEPMTPMKYFRDIARPSVADQVKRYTIGLPRTILSAVLPKEPEPVRSAPAESTEPGIADYDRAYRSALAQVGGRVSVSSDKKSAVMTISATMPDRYASADLVRVAADRLTARVIEYEAKKATEQLRFIEEQAAQAKARVERVQREQALFADRNRGTVSATAQLESQRLQREYALAFDVYQRFATAVEQARIKRSEDTPVFTVLEQVVVPDRPGSPNRPRLIGIALFLGFAGAVAVIALRRLAHSS